MQANKSKNTAPELKLRKILRDEGLTGYRIHNKNLPGKPDACFVGKRVAVFMNGCFWHRCPYCKPSAPKSNTEFWDSKFKRNVERDKENRMDLISMGFKVFTVWECQLRRNDMTVISDIRKAVQVNKRDGDSGRDSGVLVVPGHVHKDVHQGEASQEDNAQAVVLQVQIDRNIQTQKYIKQ